MKLKLQQITRGKSKYYHVYLPKNIVERVLRWHQGDNLEYNVINENLVLKKLVHPVNEYLEELSCPICLNHCVAIKIIKNPRRSEFIVVARCPIDHIIIKKFFPENAIREWKWYVHETVGICDVCGGILQEQLRKHARSTARSFYKIKYVCQNCHRGRVKVIADQILAEPENLPRDLPPPIIQKNPKITRKLPPKRCPVCEEEVLPESVFCGQCGQLLISGEF